MIPEIVPTSRVYLHSQCGQPTVVAGQSFEVVSNPMSSMEITFCSDCGKMFPISEFSWIDTGESLSDYYARHTVSATPGQRFLCSKKVMVAIIVLSALTCAAAVYQLVAADDLVTRIVVVAGSLLIGAFIGMAIFVSGIADPIKRKVCGVSDTRLLR